MKRNKRSGLMTKKKENEHKNKIIGTKPKKAEQTSAKFSNPWKDGDTSSSLKHSLFVEPSSSVSHLNDQVLRTAPTTPFPVFPGEIVYFLGMFGFTKMDHPFLHHSIHKCWKGKKEEFAFIMFATIFNKYIALILDHVCFLLHIAIMCFNQRGGISTLNASSLRLVDKFTLLGSCDSSTEKDMNTRLAKV